MIDNIFNFIPFNSKYYEVLKHWQYLIKSCVLMALSIDATTQYKV